MRRHLLSFVLLSLCVAACARKSDLPPDQVMRKSADAVRSLQSATFSFIGDFSSSQDIRLNMNAKGTLQAGGKQFLFTTQIKGRLPSAQGIHDVSADMEVAVAGESEVYLKLNSVRFTPPHPAFPEETTRSLLGTWWKLPAGTRVANSDVSANPKLLEAQSKVVRVTQDHGIEKVSGHDAYHYTVTIDPQKLTAFLQESAVENGEEFNLDSATMWSHILSGTGDLWIDRETSFVRSLQWRFTPQDPAMPFQISLQVALSDFNTAPAVSLPQNASEWPGTTLQLPAPASTSSSSKRSSSSALK